MSIDRGAIATMIISAIVSAVFGVMSYFFKDKDSTLLIHGIEISAVKTDVAVIKETVRRTENDIKELKEYFIPHFKYSAPGKSVTR